MSDLRPYRRKIGRSGRRLFTAAGLFMGVNAALLWIRYSSDLELSVAWPAIPGTIGLACAVSGLIMLYPRANPGAPRLAKVGGGFAVLSAFSLSASALSILYAAMFAADRSEFPPLGALVLIAEFLVAVVLSFLFNAIAFLLHAGQRTLGALLLVPFIMWSVMLIISALKGVEVGLALDFYTNPIIAAAFIAISLLLGRTSR